MSARRVEPNNKANQVAMAYAQAGTLSARRTSNTSGKIKKEENQKTTKEPKKTQNKKNASRNTLGQSKQNDVLQSMIMAVQDRSGLVIEQAPTSGTKKRKNFTKTEKAAYILMAIPKPEAIQLLKSLSDSELEKISAAIATLEPISSEEMAHIQMEFQSSNAESPAIGGPHTARTILEQAFDTSTANRILRTSGVLNVRDIFAFLDPIDGKDLYSLIHEELPLTVAIVLSNVARKKAAETLRCYPLDQQLQIVKHIACVREISMDLLQQIATPIRTKLSELDREQTMTIDGTETLVAILRTMPPKKRAEMLTSFEGQNADLAKRIYSRLFTPDMLYDISLKELKEFLHTVPNDDLSLFLHSAPQDIRNLVFSNISNRRKKIIEDELVLEGRVPPKRQVQATHRILQKLEQSESDGLIHFLSINDDLV